MTASAALAAFGFAGCSGEESSTDLSGACVSTEAKFAETYFNVIRGKCEGCHNLNGEARASKFILHNSAEAGFLEENLKVMTDLASLEQNGESVLLQKPLGELGHGGKKVLDENSDEYQQLVTFVQKAKEPEQCPTTEAQFYAGAQMMSIHDTAIRAALALTQRMPTEEELSKIDKGGEEALLAFLDQLMSEEAFFDNLKDTYNDVLLTDFYAHEDQSPLNQGVIGGQFTRDDNGDEVFSSYYTPRWYVDQYCGALVGGDEDPQTMPTANVIKQYGAESADDLCQKLAFESKIATARASLELIAYVVRNNKPFSEILTADYMVLNPFSAKVFGAFAAQEGEKEFTNEADRYEFQTRKIAGLPTAGVLSDPIFLTVHPTTPTNRNRHRVKVVMEAFLGTDILQLADRPLDAANVDVLNAPRDEASCNVCHARLDAAAQMFQNYQFNDPDDDRQSMFRPQGIMTDNEDESSPWYPDMTQGSWKGEVLPQDQYAKSLPWYAERMAKDSSFDIGSVQMAFRLVTGEKPAHAPKDDKDPNYKGEVDAFLGQYYTFSRIATGLHAEKRNFKYAVKQLIMSPLFRATNAASNIADGQIKKFGSLGVAKVLTPEQLDRKIWNVLGMRWTEFGNETSPYLGASPSSRLKDDNQDEWYRLLFGGIDSFEVSKRAVDPNGIMANVIERMGNEMACKWVPGEFALPREERRFFNIVDIADEPMDRNMHEVPEAQATIKAQIKRLHEKLIGERLPDGSPELKRTYELFVGTWQEGQQWVGEGATALADPCRVDTNYLTGEALAEPLTEDGLYTVRAWMAVGTYLLTNEQFVYNFSGFAK